MFNIDVNINELPVGLTIHAGEPPPHGEGGGGPSPGRYRRLQVVVVGAWDLVWGGVEVGRVTKVAYTYMILGTPGFS